VTRNALRRPIFFSQLTIGISFNIYFFRPPNRASLTWFLLQPSASLSFTECSIQPLPAFSFKPHLFLFCFGLVNGYSIAAIDLFFQFFFSFCFVFFFFFFLFFFLLWRMIPFSSASATLLICATGLPFLQQSPFFRSNAYLPSSLPFLDPGWLRISTSCCHHEGEILLYKSI